MKFGFVTCVQLGKSCMDAIYSIGGKLDLVITLEDDQAVNKSGRVYLDHFCKKHLIPLVKSSHINNETCIKAIKEYDIDWLFIIGWSQIANKQMLDAPNSGVLGIHPTLLPEGRGRASIPWAILKGLKQTGVTLFKLDEGVDTGEILDQLIIPLSDKSTASNLYDAVNKAHVELIENIFPQLRDDKVKLLKQDDSLATEWPGRGPTDGEINRSGSVFDAECLVRAVTKPYPGAYVNLDGRKCIIWSARVEVSDVKPREMHLQFIDGFLILLDYKFED
jgi:methionyl-tRNA formyltransferase